MINFVKIAAQFLLKNKKVIIQAGVFLYQNRKTIVFYYKKTIGKLFEKKKD